MREAESEEDAYSQYLDDPDNDDPDDEWEDDYWDDEDWDEDEDEDLTETLPRKRKYQSRFPKFNWKKLSEKANNKLISLIKAAECGLVPDKGLTFSYATVNLVSMKGLEDSYLRELMIKARNKIWEVGTDPDHALYHSYLANIIKYYLDQ